MLKGHLNYFAEGVEGGNFTLVRDGTCMKCDTWD